MYVFNRCLMVNSIAISPLLNKPELSFKIKKMNLINITTPIISWDGQVLSILFSY